MLVVRNSLSGKKEPFEPWNPPRVTIYACGVTTYDYCHIGHGMQALIFEMIRNYLSYIDYQVMYVRNFTDVDDKILARAAELGVSGVELSEKMVREAQKDFKALGVREADREPRVSQMIPEIISMIELLISKDSAYAVEEGHVYYRVRSKKDYGKLSHRNVDDMRSESRDVVVEGKEDPLDFALWKSDMGDFAWESPWGRGRPGWHIECSAMSFHELGYPLDVHGGGRDLLFPHHENEIAQSESCYGDPAYCKYWLHSGLLSIDSRKMSKSLGNHITLKDFLSEYTPDVLRLCCLEHHYRQDVDFSKEVFAACERKLIGYYELLRDLKAELSDFNGSSSQEVLKEMKAEFRRAMDDDFNTPRVMALLHGWFKELRRILGEKNRTEEHLVFLATFQAFLEDLRQVLGLFREEATGALKEIQRCYLKRSPLSAEELEEKIQARSKARTQSEWKLADDIRGELLDLGIVLKDNHLGETTWTIKGAEF